MKVLIIGSGGREHALAWKLLQSPKVSKLYAIPGNAGISSVCTCIDSIKTNDIQGILNFALNEKIDLTVVGPEAPLILGIGETFRKNGLNIFGPDSNGALIEGSKDFCRLICSESNVSIAKGQTFTDYNDAKKYLDNHVLPVVIKADGLAEGKGVIIAENKVDANSALKLIMLDKKFGKAGDKVIIEEFLKGYEISILAVCSGLDAILLDPSQDHKRIFDMDLGPNTGGMGAYCPVPGFSNSQKDYVKNNIILPVLKTLNKKGIDYRGVLFAGLMVESEFDIRVLEFNARFGDPETQAVLPRIESDLFEILYSAARGENLSSLPISWSSKSCVSVVAVSKGYPGLYEKGMEISGLEKCNSKDSIVFHAGTVKQDNKVLTNGGRVLAVSSLGKDLIEAKQKSYNTLKNINFENIFYRKDISDKGIQKL